MRTRPLLSLPCLLLLPACYDAEVTPPATGTETSTSTSSASGEPPSQPTTGPVTPGPEDGAPVPLDDCVTLRDAAREILDINCAGCHGASPGNGGLDTITDLDKMIEERQILGGNPDKSPLYSRIASGEMPPKGSVPATDLELFREYIEYCVTAAAGDPLAPPKCQPTDPITPGEMIDLIKTDLVQVKATDQEFTRYFSLVHLYNYGLCPPQLETYAQAISKALNSLSTVEFIHKPVAVDGSNRTIFRYDIRHSGWTKDLYHEIVCEIPFAVEYVDDNFFITNAQAVKDATDTPVFVLPGDALLHAITRPPLYHRILGIPDTLKALEDQLGLDLDALTEFEKANDQGVTAWAGFSSSDVAEFNRVIQRYLLSAKDYFWISRDHDSNQGGSNIKQNPVDLQPAGAEIIFQLKNGLQAYMIVNRDGERVDAAPIEIVNIDAAEGGPQVVNGITCMACHSRGIRVKADEIRDHVANNSLLFDVQTKAAVQSLYAPAAEFSEWQSSDKDRFLAAVNACGAAHMVPTALGDREPIFAVDIAFTEDLVLERVAAELGVSVSQILMLVAEAPFNVFAQQSLSRAEFAAVYGSAIERLQLGDGSELTSCSPGSVGSSTN